MNDEQIKEVMRRADDYAFIASCETERSADSDPGCDEEREETCSSRAALEAYLRTIGEPESVNAELLEALRTFESRPKPGAFHIGDLVKKVSGSAWEGRIVGTYSTALTPEGYAVESASHPGSVQIYPAKALTLVIQEAGIQPTEGQHAQHVDVSGANVNATFRISKQTGADALVGLPGRNADTPDAESFEEIAA